MKKLNFKYVILFFVALALFSSCLDEKGNRVSSGTFGVIRYDSEKWRFVLDVSENESFFHAQFQNDSEDNCFYVHYELDLDRPENSLENAVDSKGNYTYTLSNVYQEAVDLGMMYYTLHDTTTVMRDEVAIVEPMLEGGFWYVKGKMFIVSTMKIPKNQNMWWELSYDYYNMVSEISNRRYYDVYMRSTIRDKGTSSPEERDIPIAFDMFTYLRIAAEKEKELGGESFTIRIHYPSEISADGIITWSFQDISEPIPVSYFIN